MFSFTSSVNRIMDLTLISVLPLENSKSDQRFRILFLNISIVVHELQGHVNDYSFYFDKRGLARDHNAPYSSLVNVS